VLPRKSTLPFTDTSPILSTDKSLYDVVPLILLLSANVRARCLLESLVWFAKPDVIFNPKTSNSEQSRGHQSNILPDYCVLRNIFDFLFSIEVKCKTNAFFARKQTQERK
jgi:hypothetical protein